MGSRGPDSAGGASCADRAGAVEPGAQALRVNTKFTKYFRAPGRLSFTGSGANAIP